MHLGLQPSALPSELHVGVGHLYGLYSAPPLPVPREPVQEVCPVLWFSDDDPDREEGCCGCGRYRTYFVRGTLVLQTSSRTSGAHPF